MKNFTTQMSSIVIVAIAFTVAFKTTLSIAASKTNSPATIDEAKSAPPTEMKAISAAMHGQHMAVEFIRLNTGKYLLMVKAKKGNAPDGSAIFEDRKTIDLEIKGAEALASHYGFRCSLEHDNRTLYAVISKLKAKEKATFAPERAWFVDAENLDLKPVDEPNAIACNWLPDGEGVYPFK